MAVKADVPQAEAICIFATDLRGIEILSLLEKKLGKPVVNSNQAILFNALRILNDNQLITGFGSLLERSRIRIKEKSRTNKEEIMELGERGRIGLVLPAMNTVAEPEIYSILPKGVTAHTARMYAPVDISDEENFVRMCDVGCDNGEQAAKELATAKVDVYAFAFTAGSFYKGAGWDEEIARRSRKPAGRPASSQRQPLSRPSDRWA